MAPNPSVDPPPHHDGPHPAVSRTFSCTFIRSSGEVPEVCNCSFPGQDRMDNLLRDHI